MFPIHPVRIAHGVWIAVLASAMLPVLLLAGCSREAAVPAAATAPPGVPVATDWPLPAPMGGAQPDLVRAPDGRLLGEFTLSAPLDAALVDDTRVLHGVTPVQPIDPALLAWRDVLVVTLRALPHAAQAAT